MNSCVKDAAKDYTRGDNDIAAARSLCVSATIILK